MKIYHYTSLETLALILKHRTIRFNRLDQMDEPAERSFLFNDLNWSPYTYVSCWTANPEESLLLWHFYRQEVGVRICMDSDFIDWEKQNYSFSVAERQVLCGDKDDSESKVLTVTLNPIRIRRPLSDESCFRKISYFDDEECEEYQENLAYEENLNDNDENLFREYVGVIRKDKWAFQEESRFVIYAVPFTFTDAVMSHQEFIKLIRLGMPNPVTHIDVPIKPYKLSQIEVMLGPNATEAHYLIAQALLNKYAPFARLSLSSLSDKEVRFLV